MQFCTFLLTFGVLVATAWGAAAWPAWLDREVDLLGEAPLEEGRDLRPRGRKAAMLWLAPSAKMNFSRSSTFVLPLAVAKKGVHLVKYENCHKAVYCHFLPCQLQHILTINEMHYSAMHLFWTQKSYVQNSLILILYASRNEPLSKEVSVIMECSTC